MVGQQLAGSAEESLRDRDCLVVTHGLGQGFKASHVGEDEGALGLLVLAHGDARRRSTWLSQAQAYKRLLGVTGEVS
jgi:hypothetical protein